MADESSGGNYNGATIDLSVVVYVSWDINIFCADDCRWSSVRIMKLVRR